MLVTDRWVKTETGWKLLAGHATRGSDVGIVLGVRGGREARHRRHRHAEQQRSTDQRGRPRASRKALHDKSP